AIVLGSIILSTAVTSAIAQLTVPISFPKRILRDEPGNLVFNYVDPVSTNFTDFVDPSDLYRNAKNFYDVLVGIETVMYNGVLNPDTDPVPSTAIANMKIDHKLYHHGTKSLLSSTKNAFMSSFSESLTRNVESSGASSSGDGAALRADIVTALVSVGTSFAADVAVAMGESVSEDALSRNPTSYPDLREADGIEDMNSRSLGPGDSNFPRGEFQSLRTVLEGFTHRVSDVVEFDEGKFLNGLHDGGEQGHAVEETFGYHVTAAKGPEALFAVLQSSAVGKHLLHKLTDDGTGNIAMDQHAAEICSAFGEKIFKGSGLTTKLKAGLKSALNGAKSLKNVINNKLRTVFKNLIPISSKQGH
ncbi:hypothetical protein HDU76_008265, partial [Blyttiomyces sp. JEL0837]